MRRNLMRKKLALPFCRARRGVAGGLPLIDAHAQEIGHGCLARLDVVAFTGDGDKLGAFDLCLPLRAREAVPAALALAGLWFTHVDDDCPMTGRALA
jgi:hypothetical protein